MADRTAVFCLWVLDCNRIFMTVHFLHHQKHSGTMTAMQIVHLPLQWNIEKTIHTFFTAVLGGIVGTLIAITWFLMNQQ